ncbi:MAG TPA: hypothetical protein VIK95_06430 [Egibacteraceae bacterium]
MSRTTVTVPDQLPLLSRGKHRSPRRGACFMELASLLAGERWSDHPACTHPLLAALARGVNDTMSDEARPRLVELVPSVIGVTTDDPHADVRIALVCARTALPVIAADRQRAMAVGLLAAEQVLDQLDDRPPGTLEDASREALATAPHAVEWARGFLRGHRVTVVGFRRHGAPGIVAHTVRSLAQAQRSDTDQLLHRLLIDAIAVCRELVAEREPSSPAPAPRR